MASGNTNGASSHDKAPAHTQALWETHRRQFTQLYRDEGKPLPEVQRIMNTKYGFSATERQYKRKIKQWRLEKNVKAVEKHELLQRLSSTGNGLQSNGVYSLNGKAIPTRKLKRHARKLIVPDCTEVGANGDDASLSRDDLPTMEEQLSEIGLRETVPASSNMPKDESLFRHIFELKSIVPYFVCFVWFQKWISLGCPAGISPPFVLENLTPSPKFVEWVDTVLVTTQVASNVILLSLLYIYRLKEQNPNVIGKPGSEYRVAAVALMLANKFLDDNFYTNKTRSEVSGIAIHEMHIMEVEFLSNMRYSLFASGTQWSTWLHQITAFPSFIRRQTAETAPNASMGLQNLVMQISYIGNTGSHETPRMASRPHEAESEPEVSETMNMTTVSQKCTQPLQEDPTVVVDMGLSADAFNPIDILMEDSEEPENLLSSQLVPLDLVPMDTDTHWTLPPLSPLFPDLLVSNFSPYAIEPNEIELSWSEHGSSHVKYGEIPGLVTDEMFWIDPGWGASPKLLDNEAIEFHEIEEMD